VHNSKPEALRQQSQKREMIMEKKKEWTMLGSRKERSIKRPRNSVHGDIVSPGHTVEWLYQ